MQRTKKLLVGFLASLTVLSGSLGLAACDLELGLGNGAGNQNSSSASEETEIEKVYAQYVIYAQAEGQTPLSYEEWLATIKGEKGDTGAQGEKGDKGDTGAQGEKGDTGVGIEKVEFDENGDLLVTFTDGTKITLKMPWNDSDTGDDTEQDGGNTDEEETVIASEGLAYELLEDDTYAVVGIGDCMDTEIVIPSSYNGKAVTSIGEAAFENCDSLTNVAIGDNVTSIGDNAFNGCSNMTSVKIGGSATSIEKQEVSVCNSLMSTTLGGGVASIGNRAVYARNSLTSLTIESGVASIGNQTVDARNGSSGSKKHHGVNSIGKNAFKDCKSLVGVYISNIEAWCKILFGEEESNPLFHAGDLYVNNELVTELIIPDNVTSISDGAFDYCDSLTSVVIGNNVTSIGTSAFYKCVNLVSLEISASVTSIGDMAFHQCYKLVEVVNKSTHITIEKGSDTNGLAGYYALSVYNSGDTFTGKKVSNEDGYIIYSDETEKILITYMGPKTDLIFPSYITSIYKRAFDERINLTSVEIPDGVTSIGDMAFRACYGLKSIIIPDSITSVGEQAFYNCNGKLFSEYENVRYLGSKTNDYFILMEAKTTDLSNYTIHNNTKIIMSQAFFNCKEVTSLTIPDSVICIGKDAFYGCTNITSATCPAVAVSYIPKNVLQTVVITSGDAIAYRAFYSCDTLASVVIEDAVKSIEENAFYDCDNLASVVIGDGVTTIGNKAFRSCDKLTSLLIGKRVASIGEMAIRECISLTDITFNGTVEEWNAIAKGGSSWKYKVPATKVVCSDGEATL